MDYIDIMNGKQIYDLDTGKLVTFVNRIPDEIYLGDRNVYCDGVSVVDARTGITGGISGLYCKLVRGTNLGKSNCMNMYDFYNYFGAYEEDNARFYLAIDELIKDRSRKY